MMDLYHHLSPKFSLSVSPTLKAEMGLGSAYWTMTLLHCMRSEVASTVPPATHPRNK